MSHEQVKIFPVNLFLPEYPDLTKTFCRLVSVSLACDELVLPAVLHFAEIVSYRITESTRWEKSSDHWVQHDQTLPCPLDHGTKCHIQLFIKHLQAQWLHHLPWQPIPMSNHLFCEEFLPNVQPKTLMGQFETTSSLLLVAWDKRPTPTWL